MVTEFCWANDYPIRGNYEYKLYNLQFCNDSILKRSNEKKLSDKPKANALQVNYTSVVFTSSPMTIWNRFNIKLNKG